MMSYDDTVILLYAKAPVEGTVNTRLISDIGVQAATRLQFELTQNRLSMLKKAKLCTVHLMCTPDKQHCFFAQCERDYSVTLFEQTGRDLGERIINGVRHALSKYKYCIVIGTDAPALDAVIIVQAIDVLHSHNEVVFVPAEDGGYVLVGLHYPYEFLFQDIAWGSPEVMQQSRQQLDTRNVPYVELASCWDVDRLKDYQRYLNLQAEKRDTE
jgi:rSAM/selenodomain-associated transferase 1